MEDPPDIVHCHDLDTLLVGVAAKRAFGCKVIYDAHEYWAYSDPNAGPLERAFYARYERLLIQRADHVFTVNPLLAQRIADDYGLRTVLSVPNAAPASVHRADRRFTAMAGLAPGRLKILYHGGFAPGRGIEQLLLAWKALSPGNAALFLRGPDNAHRQKCIQLASNLNILDRGAYFIDPVSEDDLTPAASEADIGVVPYLPSILNHIYCCPNKLSQYMQAGLMVVADRNLMYVSQIVGESGCGLCYDSNVSGDLSRVLKRAIEDETLRESCREKASAYAQSVFHWTACFSPMREAYARMNTAAMKSAVAADSSMTLRAAPSTEQPTTAHGKRTILVLYYSRGVYPLRDAIRTHLYCWRHYSRCRVLYVNVALSVPRKTIEDSQPDVIVFHNLFLGMRWNPEIFRRFTRRCRFLAGYPAVKIAMPQDEFLNSELLNEFCRDFGITHVLTCADESDWPVIYDRLDRTRVGLRQVLTGYIDPETLRRIRKSKKRAPHRDIDIGYRAWKAEYWLGEHGTHKVRIAEEFERAAKELDLRTDISMRDADTLSGDAWFDFLLRCKATVGVEGGASLLDRDGTVRARVAEYVREHPAATFEETRDRCFPGRDHQIALKCVSPRHLEACATETCQFLVAGKYNGILIPWRHYVPIDPGYSNVKDSLRMLADSERVQQMTSDAFREIACSEKWTYRTFVRDIERDIINQAPAVARPSVGLTARIVARGKLSLLEVLGWQFIRFERWILNGAINNKLARKTYDFLVEYPGRF
jgi:glycosyltransferase involved in cell wall biosynthesis